MSLRTDVENLSAKKMWSTLFNTVIVIWKAHVNKTAVEAEIKAKT